MLCLIDLYRNINDDNEQIYSKTQKLQNIPIENVFCPFRVNVSDQPSTGRDNLSSDVKLPSDK
jgi:hypothetical protein